jgi:hypothetical protein
MRHPDIANAQSTSGAAKEDRLSPFGPRIGVLHMDIGPDTNPTSSVARTYDLLSPRFDVTAAETISLPASSLALPSSLVGAVSTKALPLPPHNCLPADSSLRARFALGACMTTRPLPLDRPEHMCYTTTSNRACDRHQVTWRTVQCVPDPAHQAQPRIRTSTAAGPQPDPRLPIPLLNLSFFRRHRDRDPATTPTPHHASPIFYVKYSSHSLFAGHCTNLHLLSYAPYAIRLSRPLPTRSLLRSPLPPFVR